MIFAPLVAVALVAQDSSAYLDAAARRLVTAARARRATIDRSITAYRTTMRERIGAGVRALRRDRMLYRRELALRIEWRQGGIGRIDVLGAREAVPVARPDPKLPEDLAGDVLDYAFDPADDRMTIGYGRSETSEPDSGGRRGPQRVGHPLAPGSEADYRFATGDSSAVVFQGGRTIRLRELRVIPRRLEFRLISGSLWLDEATGAVVRALFRPARSFDFEQDAGDKDDDDDIPGFVKPLRVEVRYITIDYGLWDGRWWLPRLIAMDAVATAGSFLQMPVRYERLYSDYEVTGDTTAPRAPRPSPPSRATPAEDSSARARCEALGADVRCRCRSGSCLAFEVHLPADTAAVVASTDLPPPFAGMGDTLLAAGEMEELVRGLERLPLAPWQLKARAPQWGLARYNRVEGLSLGARGTLDLGRLSVDGAARVASSDGAADVELGVMRDAATRLRLAGYRRLAAVDPGGGARSLGLGNSLAALLLGRDDGDYFRAAGVELTGAPAVTAAQGFGWRLYAERQRGARKRTDFSLAHVLDRGDVFRPNIAADSADQIGAALLLRAARGFDPEAARWGTDVAVDAGAGTFGFARASLTVRLVTPLSRRLAGAVEVAAGTSAGRVPAQSRWYLGGPNTLRGYGGGTQGGDAFWRARVEIGNRSPAARLALFTDVGRAAPRERLSLHHPLVGVGVGASFVDGLLRLDLARAVRSPTGWRLDCYVDGVL